MSRFVTHLPVFSDSKDVNSFVVPWLQSAPVIARVIASALACGIVYGYLPENCIPLQLCKANAVAA